MKKDFPELTHDLKYDELSVTQGYGSFHLSRETIDGFVPLLEQNSKSGYVNYVFGEGASPKFRNLNEGLKLIGFEPDDVLRHGDYRKLYGLKTNEGVLERLVGLDKKPPPSKTKFKDIVRAWRRRWLVNRVKREDVIQGLCGLGAGSISKSLHVGDSERLL